MNYLLERQLSMPVVFSQMMVYYPMKKNVWMNSLNIGIAVSGKSV